MGASASTQNLGGLGAMFHMNQPALAQVPLKQEFMAAMPHYNKPGVVLYSEVGMHGQARFFPLGSYPDLSKQDFARRARSLSIGPGTSVQIYTDPVYGGMNTNYANRASQPFGIADLTIFKNAISSLRIAAA